MGEISAGLEKAERARTDLRSTAGTQTKRAVLAAAGVSNTEAHRCEQIARVPEALFDGSGKEPSKNEGRLLRGSEPEPREKAAAGRPAASEGNTSQRCDIFPGKREVLAAAEVWSRRQKLSDETIGYAHALRVEALRRLGEMLAQAPKNEGRAGAGRPKLGGSAVEPPKDPTPTLRDSGLDKKTSMVAQRLPAAQDRSGSTIAVESIPTSHATRSAPLAAACACCTRLARRCTAQDSAAVAGCRLPRKSVPGWPLSDATGRRRNVGLAGSELTRAQMGTLRCKLLNVGAWVTVWDSARHLAGNPRQCSLDKSHPLRQRSGLDRGRLRSRTE